MTKDKETSWTKRQRQERCFKWSERIGAESDLEGAHGRKSVPFSTQESAEYSNSMGMSGLPVMLHEMWNLFAIGNVSLESRISRIVCLRDALLHTLDLTSDYLSYSPLPVTLRSSSHSPLASTKRFCPENCHTMDILLKQHEPAS